MYDLHVPPLNPRVCHLVRPNRKHFCFYLPSLKSYIAFIEESHHGCVNIMVSLFHSKSTQEIIVILDFCKIK